MIVLGGCGVLISLFMAVVVLDQDLAGGADSDVGRERASLFLEQHGEIRGGQRKGVEEHEHSSFISVCLEGDGGEGGEGGSSCFRFD